MTGLLAAIAALTSNATARADNQATLTAAVLVVQTKSGTADWRDDQPFSALKGGDRIRTGRRSRAAVSFVDQSVLMISQTSEVVLGEARERDVTIVRGDVFGKFLNPGTLHAPDVTVANRHTEFEVDCSGGHSRVVCYNGTVYLGPPGVDMLAGGALVNTPSTLIDDHLAGEANSDVIGKFVKLMSGPDIGTEQPITGFDPATGTITVGQAFDRSTGLPVDYVVVSEANATITPIYEGSEGIVGPNGTIGVQTAPPIDYPNGDLPSWFSSVPTGQTILTYTGSEDQMDNETLEYGTQDDSVLHGNINPSAPPNGSATITVNAQPRIAAGDFTPVESGTGATLSTISPLTTLLGVALEGGDVVLRPMEVGAKGPAKTTYGLYPKVDTDNYNVGADPADTLGNMTKFGVAHDHWLAQVGALTTDYNNAWSVKTSDALVMYRSTSLGDVKVGRQQLFVGPVNNSRIATLIDFDTVDGIVWNDTENRRIGWEGGYLTRTAPLGGDDYSGEFQHIRAEVGKGYLGVTELTANRSATHIGYSGDFSQPLFEGKINVYGEAGEDPFSRRLFTGGVYLQDLYQHTGVDVFTEYETITGQSDRVSLRVAANVIRQWRVIGYLTRTWQGDTDGGLGLAYGYHSR
ncbi:MAG: FecR family protein [Capsulimonadaceae bacterium]